MNKQTVLTIVLVAALMISVTVNVIMWCVWPRPPKDEQSNKPSASDSVKAMAEIDTPYGTLQYPKEYVSALYHKGEQEENGYTHTFSYLHDEQTIELFSVHFGDEKRGTLIGYLDADGVETSFTVTSTVFTPDDTWSEAETEQFNAMLIAINDVIASVQAWDNFIG